MTTTRTRPGPTVILSAIALVLALGGTALAGPSPLAKLTKSKVRAIAQKEIKKAAPGLSVKHAATAGSAADAAHATHADKATTADKATVAESIGGKSAADLAVRSAFAHSPDTVQLEAGAIDIASTEITTTTQSNVLASGTVEIESSAGGGDNRAICTLSIGAAASPAYGTALDDFGADNRGVVAIEFAQTVPAGTHKVGMRCTETGGSVAKDNAGINVIAVPTP